MKDNNNNDFMNTGIYTGVGLLAGGYAGLRVSSHYGLKNINAKHAELNSGELKIKSYFDKMNAKNNIQVFNDKQEMYNKVPGSINTHAQFGNGPMAGVYKDQGGSVNKFLYSDGNDINGYVHESMHTERYKKGPVSSAFWGNLEKAIDTQRGMPERVARGIVHPYLQLGEEASNDIAAFKEVGKMHAQGDLSTSEYSKFKSKYASRIKSGLGSYTSLAALKFGGLTLGAGLVVGSANKVGGL